jgi:hypothetical protein
MKSAPTIALDYRPSRAIAIAGALIVACAAGAPLLTGWPFAPKLAASLTAFGVGAASLLRFLRPPLCRIAYGEAGWQLHGRDRVHEAELVEHARIGAFLSLTWRLATGRRWHALLAPDNVDADLRRRVILLLARHRDGAGRARSATEPSRNTSP